MKILTKLILVISLLLLATTLSVGVVGLSVAKKEIENDFKLRLTEKAIYQEREVNTLLDKYRQQISSQTRKTSFIKFINNQNKDERDLVRTDIVKLVESTDILHMTIFDNQGNEILDYSEEVMYQKHSIVDDVDIFSDIDNFVQVIIGQSHDGKEVRLFMREGIEFEGEEVGYVVLAYDVENLFNVIRDYSTLGDTGETVIAQQTSDGLLQFISPLRFDPDATLKTIANDLKLAIHDAFGKGPSYLSVAIDYRGEEVVAIGRNIDLTNWVMVVKIDKSEATRTTTIIQKTATIILVTSLLVSLIVAFWFSNSFTAPITELLRISNKFSKGDLSEKVEINSKDELGELGVSFNRMAEKINELVSTLEMQVKEKTHELSEKMITLENKTTDQGESQQAMINLLEDAKTLEEELKREKEGVEKKVEERTTELKHRTIALEEARKKATAGWVQLQAEKARLNASMEALPLGMVIVDKLHEVIVFNKKIIDISENTINEEGSTEQFEKFIDELGLSVDEICPHCNDLRTYINEAINYKNKFIKVMVVPVKSEEEVIGSTYLFEDVTEARKLQKTRDEFFSVASHELRTPLTAIRGNTQMLQDYYPEIQNNAEVKEMVTDIHTASVRLIGIVNDFLDASRLELKKTEMKISQFSINELVEKIMEQVNPESVGRELEYKLNISEGMEFEVSADRDRLEQVLINLIGNAFKFTKEGGVYLSIEKGDEGFVKVNITDTGVGISKVDQAELFAKFKQVGSNAGLARDVSQGTGMGLYISKLIMEATGGKVYLGKSIEGEGSTFVIEIPAAK